MTRILRSLVPPVLMMGLIASSIPAQQASAVLRATVQYVSNWVTEDLERLGTRQRPVLSVDARVLSVVATRGKDSIPTTFHPTDRMSAASVNGVSTVMSSDRSRQCSGGGAAVCGEGGVFTKLRFAPPTIDGRTATIDVFLEVSRPPTATDSAKASAGGEAALRRLARGSGWATQARLTLEQQANGEWRVVSRKVVGQS